MSIGLVAGTLEGQRLQWQNRQGIGDLATRDELHDLVEGQPAELEHLFAVRPGGSCADAGRTGTSDVRLFRQNQSFQGSMTSTPRTEPIRQGLHLPQDSMAQNSIANRACSAMLALSSNTTMPPWPTMAPISMNAS